MKDRILNILMLASVFAALTLTLITEKELPAAPVFSPEALSTLSPSPSPQPIEAYRIRRENTRKEETSALSALAENPGTDEKIRIMAQEEMTRIIQRNEMEMALEAALIARGYPDALCIFQAGTLTILFSTPLQESDAQWIFHLAQEISSLEMENIRLSAC